MDYDKEKCLFQLDSYPATVGATLLGNIVERDEPRFYIWVISPVGSSVAIPLRSN